MRRLSKMTVLAAIGGVIYGFIELLWRGHTHWTMIVMGGVLFVLIGAINNYYPWEMSLLIQGVIGAVMVTACELVFGLVINVWLGWAVWDYSAMPFNFLGQICLPYTAAWVLLSIVAVVLDDWLRYLLFKEGRPHYVL